MNKKIIAIIIALLGLVLIIFPFRTGQPAYFAGENFYVNIKDSVDLAYKPFIDEMVSAVQNKKAFKEKEAFRNSAEIKKISDSLNLAGINALEKKKLDLLKEIDQAKNDLARKIMDYEASIDEKYDVNKLSKEEFNQIATNISDTLTLEKYIVNVANTMRKEIAIGDVKNIDYSTIFIKDVNKQDATPFVISGIFLLFISLFIILLQEGIIPLHFQSVKYFSILTLLFLSIYLGYNIYRNLYDAIEFEETVEMRSEVVKEKLSKIRQIQITHLNEKGKYAKTWDQLIKFTETDSSKVIKFLVNKDDSAAVNNAIRKGLPLEDTVYVSVREKVFGQQKVNFEEIKYVPFSKDTFEINAGNIDRNGTLIQVFEVRTTKYNFVKDLSIVPLNFDKTKSLILGSMSEPSTEGNW